ncbi:MAG: hypothetical protein DI570_12550 [Phenylobacterium zucineum]|nr:MAG: hypothetical protein DI570_12550 [Phenylobacterium zucineum]
MFRPILICAAAAVALGGCATSTPYQPLAQAGPTRGGYAEQVIEPERLRVTFAGNALTTREEVELGMLYRAAELTVARGYDWFELADRATDKKTTVYGGGPSRFGSLGFGHGVGHGFGHGVGFGHHGWASWHGAGFYDGFGGASLSPQDRYTAVGEVLIRRGPKPADNAEAFDARAVLQNLGPRIHRPEQKG